MNAGSLTSNGPLLCVTGVVLHLLAMYNNITFKRINTNQMQQLITGLSLGA